MPSRLGDILLDRGLVTSAQLEAALQSQTLQGGRLGTNLVQLGGIELDAVARALGVQFGLPPGVQVLFEEIQPSTVRLVSPELATRHGVIPLGFTLHRSKTLAVAFPAPPPASVLDELTEHVRARVMVVAAPELRLVYAMEKHYGIPRPARFLRVSPSGPVAEEPVTQRAELPPPPVRNDRRRLLQPSGEIRQDGPQAGPPPAVPLAPPPELPAPAARPTLTAAQAMLTISRAQGREEIGEALCDFLRSSFSAGLVFIVRDRLALGWKGFAPGVDGSLLESIALPLDPPSCLRVGMERRAPFRGRPPPEGQALHARLWKLLQVSVPEELIVAPICVRDRVVALLYGQPGRGDLVADAALVDVATVCSAASASFVRLIQSAKRAEP